jgi:hypothetical protein
MVRLAAIEFAFDRGSIPPSYAGKAFSSKCYNAGSHEWKQKRIK